MNVSDRDLQFVARRERLTRWWPVFGLVLLLLITCLIIWLWIRVPYMINPWIVADGIKSAAITESTLMLMAAMLPIVMLALLLFALLTVALFFVCFANERRLIRLLRMGSGLEL